MKEIPPDCITSSTDKIVVLKDCGSFCKFTIKNPHRKQITKIKVDGCAVTEGLRCDYLVLDALDIEHYVELKGSDVDHAIKQLKATILQLSEQPKTDRKYCYVVSTRCPLDSTKIQQYRIKFRKDYNSDFIVKTREGSITL